MDIAQIQSPFAMRPGLVRMGVGERHFHALGCESALRVAKSAAWAHDSSFLTVPGLEEEDIDAALRAIEAQMRIDSITSESIASSPMNTSTNGLNALKIRAKSLSEAVEEDFCLLDGRTASPWRGTVPLMCVTCPSHWAPEQKLGLSLAEIHAPVADNALLLKATDGLVQLATSGQRWQRWVWTITPSPRFDAHPERHSQRVWPASVDVLGFASACFFRSERQTLFAVLDIDGHPTGMAIFTIQVRMEPLTEAVQTSEQAKALRDSLASMSPAVLAYKGLDTAHSPLLAWLNLIAHLQL